MIQCPVESICSELKGHKHDYQESLEIVTQLLVDVDVCSVFYYVFLCFLNPQKALTSEITT